MEQIRFTQDLNKKALTLISEKTLNVSSKLPYMDISYLQMIKFSYGEMFTYQAALN